MIDICVHTLNSRAITAGGRYGSWLAAWSGTATTSPRSSAHSTSCWLLPAIPCSGKRKCPCWWEDALWSRPSRESRPGWRTARQRRTARARRPGAPAGGRRPGQRLGRGYPAAGPALPGADGRGVPARHVVRRGRTADLGVLAAMGAGVDPGRMILVPEPGPQWAEVTATMLDACEVVLLRPPDRPPAQARRRLETATRRSGAALIVAGTGRRGGPAACRPAAVGRHRLRVRAAPGPAR